MTHTGSTPIAVTQEDILVKRSARLSYIWKFEYHHSDAVSHHHYIYCFPYDSFIHNLLQIEQNKSEFDFLSIH